MCHLVWGVFTVRLLGSSARDRETTTANSVCGANYCLLQTVFTLDTKVTFCCWSVSINHNSIHCDSMKKSKGVMTFSIHKMEQCFLFRALKNELLLWDALCFNHTYISFRSGGSSVILTLHSLATIYMWSTDIPFLSNKGHWYLNQYICRFAAKCFILS